MKKFTVEEAKQDLDKVLEHANEDGTVIIIGDDDVAYELVATIIPKRGPRKAGLFKDQIKITDEFYEPLPEFKPYME
ncbi:MAG: type II toxin-antitoxin system prevent-host-death family antitoxin [Chloroflexota bacterium]|nr:type II toxin-antitoxin system prevent-host-death family antitoxin [Chloroflexota bacterium]MDE2907987.1 type II toxin-antitoxin system prevent-host-death family antitoxin [Chloroflexota bacterium]